MSKFYDFRQNNSGGGLVGPQHVVVEANSPEEANEIATSRGPVYFNGCDDGTDWCCCGDRWYGACECDVIEEGEIANLDSGIWNEAEVLVLRADGSSETITVTGSFWDKLREKEENDE